MMPCYLLACDLLGITGSVLLILFIDKMDLFIIFIVVNIVVFILFGYYFALQLQGTIVVQSTFLLHFLKAKCRNEFCHRINRSLFPIRGRCGFLYQCKASTVLTIFGII